MESERKSPAGRPTDNAPRLRIWHPPAEAVKKARTLGVRLKSVGKRLEDAVREARYHVSPANQSTYFELAMRQSPPPEGSRLVACDFRSPLIDFVGGRYLYHLIHDLVSAGYTPVYRRNYRFLASMRSKSYKRMLLDLPLYTYGSESDLLRPELLVTDCLDSAQRTEIDRVVLLDYEHRRAGAGDFALQFGLNPTIVAKRFGAIDADLESPRPNGVYFAGNIDDKGYDRDVLRDRYRVVTRRELIRVLQTTDQLPAPFVPTEPGAVGQLSDGHPIALAIKAGCRVAHADWLRQMADADFFLGCPGTQMPMCHNLIEALAVGTIPILEYEKYTVPALEEGVNCLTFRGADEAVSVLRRALGMSLAEKNRLRRGAHEFYLRHHAPGRMVESMLAVEANPVTLVMNDYRVPRADKPAVAPTIRLAPTATAKPFAPRILRAA